MIWTHGFLCYILGYNPILLYFVAHIVPALHLGDIQLVPMSLWHTCFIFLVLPSFGALQDAPDSSYIFPAPVLESGISPRSLIPLMENGNRNQHLEARCASCYWVSFLLGNSTSRKCMCVYSLTYLHIYRYSV